MVTLCQAFTDGRRSASSFRCVFSLFIETIVMDLFNIAHEPKYWVKFTRMLYLPYFRNPVSYYYKPVAFENDILLVGSAGRSFSKKTYIFDLTFQSIFPIQFIAYRRYGPVIELYSLNHKDQIISDDYVIRQFVVNTNQIVYNSERLNELKIVVKTYPNLIPEIQDLRSDTHIGSRYANSPKEKNS